MDSIPKKRNRYTASFICQQCGGQGFTEPFNITQGTARFCSRQCTTDSMRVPKEQCFWSKVIVSEGCWSWTGHRGRNGYGIVNRTHAHRVSWELHFGPIPADFYVCHHCDNPPCTRPDHLFLGTAKDNARDRDVKGRGIKGRKIPKPKHSKFGERHSSAKFTDADVKHIRQLLKLGHLQKHVARQYGVTPGAISQIARRLTWRHLD